MTERILSIVGRFGRLGAVALASLFASACGSSLTKKEFFVAYDDKGNASYYRVEIDGAGSFGEMEYRSGWFDAAAVDGLFGDLPERRRLEKVSAKEQEEAVKETLKAYLDVLKDKDVDPASPLVQQRRAAYAEALNAVSGFAPAGTKPDGALFYNDKKFVIMLSNDPDKLLAAIKERVQGEKLVNALKNAQAGERTTRVAKTEREAQVLLAQVSELEKGITGTVTGDSFTNQALRNDLSKLAGQLEGVQ